MKWFYAIIFFQNILFSQISINSSFNNVTQSAGEINYSIGQVFFENHSNNSQSISNGIHSYVEIRSLNRSYKNKKINLSVYPNPTSNILNITFQKSNFENSKYQIFNIKGDLVKKGNITTQNTIINIDNLPSAMYYLFIYRKGKTKASFKILKY
jgi:hypothetical protein